MYDEPPDPPPPELCSMCESELGYTEDCALCATVLDLNKAEIALADIKRLVWHRVRILCSTYTPGEPLSAEFFRALMLIMSVAEMPVDSARLELATRMTLTFGNMTFVYGDAKRDAALCDKIAAGADARVEANKLSTYTHEILDWKPRAHQCGLWLTCDKDGRHHVMTEGEKDAAGLGGVGHPTNQPLRTTIDDMLCSVERNSVHWAELQADLAKPMGEIKQGVVVHYVTDEFKAYTANVGMHNGKYRGFGGAKFKVRLDDGREFETNDNWSRGTVPVYLRKLIRPTARFISGTPVHSAREADAPALSATDDVDHEGGID